jgi:hypothetical protein
MAGRGGGGREEEEEEEMVAGARRKEGRKGGREGGKNGGSVCARCYRASKFSMIYGGPTMRGVPTSYVHKA